MFIGLAVLLILIAILSGFAARLGLRYSNARSLAVAGIVLVALYALLLIVIVALRPI
jgi:hypothetical protein